MPRPLRIVIDPGHGGKDAGAVGFNRTEEAQVNLQVGLYLGVLMRSAGVDCWMTRQTDKTVELRDRLQLARDVKADLFLSIHCNSGGTGAEGIETIYEASRGPLDLLFANTLQEGLAADFKFHKNRGIKDSESEDYPRSIYVVQKAPCTAAIVELEFISNPKQEFWLRKPETHDALAFSLRKSVLAFANAHLRAMLEA